MMEIEQETHTIRSHGSNVARMHTHDWLILMLLIVIDIILNCIHPFNRFVGKDMMTDLKYPLKEDTIPFWAVPILAVLLPLAVFLFVYFRRRDIYDLHHAMLGILYSALITMVITDATKVAIGRPRPDFFWRCFPDGKDVYDRWGNVVCHGIGTIIRQGRKSFPSGHTSLSFAGLAFLSLYLSGKIKAFDSKGHIAKLCVVIFPLLLASMVGISRVDNYKHHWQDVFTGGLLGIVMATFCYLQFFPPPYHAEGWGPYAYFKALEQAQSTTVPADTVSSRENTNSEGANRVNQQEEIRNDTFIGTSIVADSISVTEDLETGRMRM